MSPLAAYLSANLATMKQLAEFAPILPTGVAAIMEDDPQEGVVYLLDAHQQVLGHIEAHQDNGAIVPGLYVYLPLDRVADDVVPFRLDFSKPVTLRSAALGPARTGPPEPPRRVGR